MFNLRPLNMHQPVPARHAAYDKAGWEGTKVPDGSAVYCISLAWTVLFICWNSLFYSLM